MSFGLNISLNCLKSKISHEQTEHMNDLFLPTE